LERTRKEAVIAYFKVLNQHFEGGIENNCRKVKTTDFRAEVQTRYPVTAK
jgi:hypothetical protein